MIGLNRPLDTTNGLKLLGERNSGTNVLEHLLQHIPDLHLFPSLPMLTWREVHRFRHPLSALWRYHAAREETLDHWHTRDLPISGGWKHAAPNYEFRASFLKPKQPAVLIMLRHPASWLRSMHRNPFHALTTVPADFSAFIRKDWAVTARDGVQSAPLPALYAAKLKTYADLLASYPNSALIRYEDLLSDPTATLTALGLEGPAPFALPADDPRAFAKPSNSTSFGDRATASFDGLSAADRAFVRGCLDGSPASDLYPS